MQVFQAFFLTDLKTEEDIPVDASPFQKMVFLEHISNAWIAGRRRDAVHKNRAFFCREHAADQIQERGLSAAGWTDNGKKFTGHQVKRYI